MPESVLSCCAAQDPAIADRHLHRSDPELIAACMRNDRLAWDTLVDRYRRLVYSIPVRYHMTESDADDVFQGVFLILFQKLESLKDQTRLSGWLITTTHRECWRIGRDRKRALDLENDFADVSQPDDQRLEQWERQQLVRQALAELGGQCEELLAALFLTPAEVDYERIAARLGMKVGSIGPTRARCFKKLEPILTRMGLEPAGGLNNP